MKTYRITEPTELATSLPYQLGVSLDRDIAVLVLRDKRITLVLRFDVPAPETRVHIPEAARDAGDHALVISYGVRPEECDLLPIPLVQVTEAVLAAGFSLVDVWTVADGQIGFPLDPHMPAQPLPDPGTVPLVAEWVTRGHTTEFSRRDWDARLELREPGRPRRRVLRSPDPIRAMRVWSSVFALGDDRPSVQDVVRRPDASHAMSALLRPGFLDCLLSIVAPSVRDELWARSPEIARAQRAAGLDLPDWQDAAGEWRSRLIEVLAWTPDFARGCVLVLIAAVSWELGDGVVAGAAVERALREDPGNCLAMRVSESVVSGRCPARAS